MPAIRRILALIGLSLAASHWPLASSQAADWPQFLGPNRNCTSSETGLLTEWPKDGPPLVWKKDVGAGFSGPVVAGERLILFHRVGDKDKVECLDTATGKAKWEFAYKTTYEDDYQKGDGPRSTPVIAGNRVYTLSAEGKLHCLDLENGKKLWDRSLNTEYSVKKAFFGVGTSPIVVGDKLIVNVGGKEALAGIVAFDKETGKEAWKSTDQEASYSSPVTAKIDGVDHVLFLTRAGILSVDPADGKARFAKPWKARILASVNAAAPVVAGDLLFVSSSYGTGAIVHKVKKDSIAEVWKGDEIISNHYNTSVHQDGFLYGIDGRQEGGGAKLRCVELMTGKVRWTKTGFGCASIILADGQLITLNDAGDLVLIAANPDEYKEKARAVVLGTGRAEIALANGRLYARDGNTLKCWNLKK